MCVHFWRMKNVHCKTVHITPSPTWAFNHKEICSIQHHHPFATTISFSLPSSSVVLFSPALKENGRRQAAHVSPVFFSVGFFATPQITLSSKFGNVCKVKEKEGKVGMIIRRFFFFF